jgi:hypothetical protein
MVTSGFARSVYLPEGTWLDFWESRTFAGGGDVIVQPPAWGLPLFIRGGSIIPMRLNEGLEVGGGGSGRTLLVFNVDARAAGRALVFEGSSAITARYERKGSRVEIQVDECPDPYGLRVRCGDPLRMTLPRGETLRRVSGRESFAGERAAWCYEFAEQHVLAKFTDGRERSVVLEGAGQPIEFAGWSARDQVRASAASVRLSVATRGLPAGARARLEYGIAGRKLSLTAEGKPTGGGTFEFRVPVPAEAATSPTPTDLRYRAVLVTDRGELPSAERIVRIVPRG